MQMLYIGRKQMEKIISLNELMEAIEEAFKIYESKDFHMPDRLHVDRDEGTILYMPCFIDEYSCTKIVSTFPKNISKGVPSVQGTMVLNDSKTGVPLAIMDGAAITAYRTGAVGGVGVKYTSREDCESVGLVGAGVQGFYQLLYTCEARPIKNIYLYDISQSRAEDLKNNLEEKLEKVSINIADSSQQLVENSEIIITATPSEEPVLPNESNLLRGKHIIAIGSYKLKMREIPEALYHLLDEIYVDTDLASRESGDLLVPLKNGWIKQSQIKSFSKLLAEGKKINKDKSTSLYKSVGMALFDLIVTKTIYEKALANDIGQRLDE
jgi:ornithine cyclodeaminase